jgi:hypothetical protein
MRSASFLCGERQPDRATRIARAAIGIASGRAKRINIEDLVRTKLFYNSDFHKRKTRLVKFSL